MSAIFASLGQFSNRIALISADGERVTFGSLLERGEELASRVCGRCLAISLSSNTPEFVAGYVGFMRAGIVQLLVNENIATEFLTNLISIYSPSCVYLPAARVGHVQGGEVRHSHGGYRLIGLDPSKAYEINDKLALLLSTSGSTGSPKLVRLSYRNLQANTESIIQYLGIRTDDRTITTLPLSYSYGLSILNTHLAAGASVVVTDAAIVSREFWKLLKANAVTSFGGVPYTYEMLKKLKFSRLELPSLRYITQAGGKLNPTLAREFTEICLKKKIRFYIMYGQTEATARISYLCATDHPGKAGSIGGAIPGGELWILGTQGERVVESDTAGELAYRGENVALGFAETGWDLALGDTQGGVLKTGDLATRDEDGFYHIVGRKSHFLKIFGIRVNLMELEEILKSRGYECACSGTDETLCIYLTQLDDKVRFEAMISELTGIHRNGFQVVRIDAIPRSSSGKVLYSALDAFRK